MVLINLIVEPSDNTSDSIVYEEKPTIQNVPLFQQPIENVFELSKFLKK